MEAKTKDLWVFVETKEDGSAKNVGIELLSPAVSWRTRRAASWSRSSSAAARTRLSPKRALRAQIR